MSQVLAYANTGGSATVKAIANIDTLVTTEINPSMDSNHIRATFIVQIDTITGPPDSDAQAVTFLLTLPSGATETFVHTTRAAVDMTIETFTATITGKNPGGTLTFQMYGAGADAETTATILGYSVEALD